MAAPSNMQDMSITAASNTPPGTEGVSSLRSYLLAIQAILRRTNAKASDIASATTTDIGAATAEFVDVTGTTTITGFGTIAAGIVRTVRFTGALTLTHNATSLILPGGANITTAANDVGVFRSLGSGNWICVGYKRQSGTPIVGFNGGTITTDLTLSASTLVLSKGADVASATALPLITDGNYFDVTGTTTVTSFDSVGVGAVVKLHFDGALILTHHATDLILPTGANITTAAGDEAEFVEYASGDWRCTNYVRANGMPLAAWVYLAKQNATSGTAITFTGIPSWATEIEMKGNLVSTNGTANTGVQLGDAGGLENSGYSGMVARLGNSGGVNDANSTMFIMNNLNTAALAYDFNIKLSKYDGNTWEITGHLSDNAGSNSSYCSTIGFKTLSDTLTQVAFITTNAFDGSGTIVVRYR